MENLNTDKIYAEQLASEYAPKDTTRDGFSISPTSTRPLHKTSSCGIAFS